jgi:hypothetical protein
LPFLPQSLNFQHLPVFSFLQFKTQFFTTINHFQISRLSPPTSCTAQQRISISHKNKKLFHFDQKKTANQKQQPEPFSEEAATR